MSCCKPKDLCVPYHPLQVITLSPPSNPSKPHRYLQHLPNESFQALAGISSTSPGYEKQRGLSLLMLEMYCFVSRRWKRKHLVLVPAGLEGFFTRERQGIESYFLFRELFSFMEFTMSGKQKFDHADLRRSHLVWFMAGRLTSFGRPAGGNGLPHPSPLTEDRC